MTKKIGIFVEEGRVPGAGTGLYVVAGGIDGRSRLRFYCR
jgi:hypothetical protein